MTGVWWEETEGEEISQTVRSTRSGGKGKEFGVGEGGQLLSTIKKGTWEWSGVVDGGLKEKVK
jgi:hypothetical protein